MTEASEECNKTNICDLPIELLSMIFSHLDIRSQISFSSVNQQLRHSLRNLRKNCQFISFQGSPGAEWYMIDIKTDEYTWRREFFTNYRNVTEVKSTFTVRSLSSETLEKRKIRGIRPGELVETHSQALLKNINLDTLLIGVSSILKFLPSCRMKVRVLIAPSNMYLEPALDHVRPSCVHISHVEDKKTFNYGIVLKDYITSLTCDNLADLILIDDVLKSKLRSLIMTTDLKAYDINDILTFLEAWRKGETILEHFKISGMFHADLAQCPGFEEAIEAMGLNEPGEYFPYSSESTWKIKQNGTGREAYISYGGSILTFCTVESH